MASNSGYEIYCSSTLMILISWGALKFKCIHSGTLKQWTFIGWITKQNWNMSFHLFTFYFHTVVPKNHETIDFYWEATELIL